MPKGSKPVQLMSKHLTKTEKQNRIAEEKKLKGNNDLVYVAPSHLSIEEQNIYKFLVDELQSSDILNNLDITILETTVDAIVKMKECKELLGRFGLIQEKEDGTLSRNPASTIYKDYNTIYNKCCTDLGLSPSARSKLSSLNLKAKEEKEDPVLKAIKKGKK